MSDFDKEAEREKLREKYEQEQAEREATEKMSELLLQGATMTNAHCSECGDPIFRYDGQEFCATCEKAVDRDTEGAEADEDVEVDDKTDDGADNADDDRERIEVTSPDDSARVRFGDDGTADGQPANRQPAADQQSPAEQQPSADQQSAQSQGQQTQQTRSSHQQRQPQQSRGQPTQPERTRQVPGVEPSETGDVSAARESLVRTLSRFAQQAEATEDPQRAQEYLAAAREAADALAALRQ